MMRLPRFHFVAPESLGDAADVLAAAAPGDAMIVAGGTDLIPNMKRRQQVPGTLVGLRRIPELRAVTNGDGLTFGAGLTLTALIRDLERRGLPSLRGLQQAAASVATPHLRNMGTIGGNLCLDTRCNYYDQNYEWRKAIDFCMKKDGETCWVATSSPKCLAVSSTDTAPAFIALGATATLLSARGTRSLPVGDLYRNDGIDYLTRSADEIVTSVHVPDLRGWQATYWKLRRRGSFDFPVLSVAAAIRRAPDGSVDGCRIVLGAVASHPVDVSAAGALLVGTGFEDAAIAACAETAARPSRPMDNTDFSLVWRKRMTKTLITYALRELRGDDLRAERMRVARQLL
jgi:4-hydroxybenzoyl-CoA reductase subunit beta